MSEPETSINSQDIWQILLPILDECIAQSLRDMDDPDAERDQHDADRLFETANTLEDLADLLVPYRAVDSCCDVMLNRLRSRIMAQAANIREAGK